MPEEKLTGTKPFKKPWKVGGIEAADIEFRDADVGDLTKAEEEANPSLYPTAFNVALACETCVRAGSFTGPFTAAQFKTMSQAQWVVARNAMGEAAKLGEG